MDMITKLGILILAYILGSIPFGLIFVRLRTGKDIRDVQSGRTGGTNAMRAAGVGVGFITAVMDILKGAGTVWLANYLMAPTPDPWIQALAPIGGILGHNYSIFLIKRLPNGKLRLGGGAGGATCLGGSLGLWGPAGAIIFTIAVLIFYFVGYASVTTLSVAALSIIIFTYRAITLGSPWAYVAYGIIAQFLLIYTLLPNIKRLREGTERLHGYRARGKKQDSKS